MIDSEVTMGYTVPYEITITPTARKELKSLPIQVQGRIRKALEKLSIDPFSPALDVKNMKGQRYYRLRVGDYRVIYDVQSQALVIMVVNVGHRQYVYH